VRPIANGMREFDDIPTLQALKMISILDLNHAFYMNDFKSVGVCDLAGYPCNGLKYAYRDAWLFIHCPCPKPR
jgi:hypothetical protein